MAPLPTLTTCGSATIISDLKGHSKLMILLYLKWRNQ